MCLRPFTFARLFLRCKVTIALELHLAKGTKFKSSKAPFAHYDIYLHRAPETKPPVANWPRARTPKGPSRARGRVLRWEDDMYPPSPPCSVCSPLSTRSLPANAINERQRSRPRTRSPYSPR
ncbi:hypothetical protein VZT92_027811 [Zoarces viviparus]|uniref:Secreted protein n=1 Tax=Zoarces viviparus TaxID=48416 RepID=A0AAW1DWZ5_ZOAVI